MSDQSSSRSGRLDKVVGDLLAQAPEIEAAAVVSFDGLPMVSALPMGMDEDRVAAMSAALLSLGERAAEGLGRGQLSQVYIEGESGTVFLVSCDDEAVLVAVAAEGAKAGLMLYEVRRAAAAVATVLREDEPLLAPVPPLPPSFTQQPHPAAEPVRSAETVVPTSPPPFFTATLPVAEPTAVLPTAVEPTIPVPGGFAGESVSGWSSYGAADPAPWS